MADTNPTDAEIEHMARALCLQDGFQPDGRMHYAVAGTDNSNMPIEPNWHRFRASAKAALIAMATLPPRA